MGIFGEIFGNSSEKNAEFKAPETTPAAEMQINPENKQEVLPDASKFTAESGRMIADVEKVEEVPSEISKLEEVINQVNQYSEKLPQQN